MHQFSFPRITISGLRGGSGKTIISLALTWLFTQQGFKVKAFKKGPDYIDAKWLSLASGNNASNLDPFLFSTSRIQSLFNSCAIDYDLAVIEGNRGLFDGMDTRGSCSTSELARILQSPVLLVLDCTKVTRTTAAIVRGCSMFEENLDLAGVVLNQTAGARHRDITRRSIEKYTDVPVLGALPKLKDTPIPERHMGLISSQEYQGQDEIFSALGKVVADNIDIERVLSIAGSAPACSATSDGVQEVSSSPPQEDSVIGVVRDRALWFYYQENLDALRQQGAKLVELSLLTPEEWPRIHGLYLGGGFPETSARELSANTFARQKVKELADQGLPVYAECGGFMYLADSLHYEGEDFDMAGVFHVQTRVYKKPQGHGYIRARIMEPNPFYSQGESIVGHEFHYSRCLSLSPDARFCMRMERGTGMVDLKDGLLYRNVLAGYAHVHAFSVENWAVNFVSAAGIFREHVDKSTGPCPDIVCK